MEMDHDRPTLHFTNDVDGIEIHMAFEYYKDEPTMALYHGNTLVLIPKDILQIALEQGWDMECPHCEKEKGVNDV